MSHQSIFEKIIKKEIPADIVFEDDKCIVIKDINPVAKVHLLVIPKEKLPRAYFFKKEDSALLGHLMYVASNMARLFNLEEGFRIVINDGKEGCQTVFHLHLHVIGGE